MPIEVYFPGGRKVNAKLGSFEIKTDQSVASGGEGSAPEPFALFLASLATCAGIYVKSFCDNRQIPADRITLTMDYESDPVTKLLSRMIIKILVPPDFPEKYDSAVINAAALCKVKKHLKESIGFEITVSR
ncbi:MAG: OsmC family protein [Bacteroidetes bacterium]|nr:OsmC family protein [Bacteroidota bacterium]